MFVRSIIILEIVKFIKVSNDLKKISLQYCILRSTTMCSQTHPLGQYLKEKRIK